MIEVFKQETLDGLVEKIKASTIVHYVSKLEHDVEHEIPDSIKAHMRSNANHTPILDLYPIKSILVSTVINLNDDYFGPEPTYAAKDTVADKPFNYNHIGTDIIGHMTASYVIDDNGQVVVEGNIPNKFHIVNSAVLYKYWDDDKDKQERMDSIIAEVSDKENNKWYVSMECRFTGFDYVLIPIENNVLVASKAKIIARNEETAYLSKHLRAYGGSGKYNGYKIGRAVKNITFSGIGLVRNPANPESIILNSKEISSADKKFNDIPSELVYNSSDKESKGDEMANKKEETIVAEEKTTEVVTVTPVVYTEAQYKELEAKLEEVNKNLVASQDELTKTKTQYDEIVKVADETKAKLEIVEKELATVSSEMATAKKGLRLEKVKKVYKFEKEEDAVASVETLANLNDEAFDKHLALVAKITPVNKENTTPSPAKIEANVLEKVEKVEEVNVTVTDKIVDDYSVAQSEFAEWWGMNTNTGKKEE